MLIFDQLKKNDPQLRALAVAIVAGLCVLAAGLWWVQIVSARDYQTSQETQSSRTVRMPAVRGRILDRNGTVLAENRPVYNVSLYLDDFRNEFDKVSSNRVWAVRKQLKAEREAAEKSLPPRFSFLGITWPGRLSKAQQKQFSLSLDQKDAIKRQARYEVCSNVVINLQTLLKISQPTTLNPTNFEKHYLEARALPYPILTNLSPAQVALVEEKCANWIGVDLELVSTRVYPYQNTAAHILGYVRRNKDSVEGDPAYYDYRLEGFQGQLGIEAGKDKELRGKAGSKIVLVNSAGYRQTENTDTPVETGSNVVLTIDLELQTATEKALRLQSLPKKAAVVMDVRTGDILAMASMPTYNPNAFVQKLTQEEYNRLNDPDLKPQMNRATQGKYAPGSIFKTLVGMGFLEKGLDPSREFYVAPNPKNPARGVIYVKGEPVKDTAPPGMYDFKKALIHSSNSYFITNGLAMGIENIIELGHKLHLGETTGVPTHQENGGGFPPLERARSQWPPRSIANFCIGQDPVYVTPLQMTVLAAAIANGGTVLYPRLVERVYPSDPTAPPEPIVYPARVRDHLGISTRTMRILHEAMLADVEDANGTGRAAYTPDMRVCGKTGTAQIQDAHGNLTTHTVWMLSFAPYPQPKYAVVVMVEGGTSGGGDCAPLAGEIYRAIVQWEKTAAAPKPIATNN
jgi:penicillin-binding protein 2